jgi:hypothetical protein
MDMSFAALIAIGLVALLLLGGLLVTLLLLAHPKSRPIGLALLGVGVVGVVIVGGLGFLLWNDGDSDPETLHETIGAGDRSVQVAKVFPPSDEAAAAGDPATTPARPSTSSRQPSRVIRALTAALARGIQETKEDQKEPGTTPAASEPSEPPPGWIDMEPELVGDTYRVSVVIGPFQTRPECDAALPDALDRALADYTRRYLGPAAAAKVHFPSEVLEERLVQERWEETKQFETVGPMKQLHVLLEFDATMQQDIAIRWDEARLSSRLWYTGTGLAALLALLAVAYGGLLADRVTEGRRRGRLGFAAVAAAALIVVAAAAVIGAAG